MKKELTIKEQVDQLFTNGYIDDHTGWFGAKDDSIHMPEMVIIWINHLDVENAKVCFATDKGYYSINPFYYNETDNMMHLSTWSCGATMTTTPEQHNRDYDYNNMDELQYHYEHVIVVRKEAWERQQRRIQENKEKYGAA